MPVDCPATLQGVLPPAVCSPLSHEASHFGSRGQNTRLCPWTAPLLYRGSSPAAAWSPPSHDESCSGSRGQNTQLCPWTAPLLYRGSSPLQPSCSLRMKGLAAVEISTSHKDCLLMLIAPANYRQMLWMSNAQGLRGLGQVRKQPCLLHLPGEALPCSPPRHSSA